MYIEDENRACIYSLYISRCMYPEPSQTPKLELFAKIDVEALNTFTKSLS